MYGKIKEKKLKEADEVLSCEEVRRQLDEYMDVENRRVNVDSAKKLAVMQHMDYEGFRQMVLGANIFPTKSKELTNFSKGGDLAEGLNKNKLFEEKKEAQRQNVQISYEVSGKSEMHCLNFRDFKKKLLKHYSKELDWERVEQCYKLIKEQNEERLKKIFSLECEADILIKIVEVFSFVRDYLSKEKGSTMENEVAYMIKFFEKVLGIKTMEINLNALSKKEKEKIKLFMQECSELLAISS